MLTDHTLFAAADLGSNSFHMIVARCTGGRFTVIDRARTVVRLAAGIDKRGGLEPETRQRALEALRQFRIHLLKVPPSNVRVVGTSGVRRLDDQGSFVTEASEILGLPIEIITGEEEARLINLGVAGTGKDEGVVRLIVDIGGGSTEIIVARDRTILVAESLPMGCVVFSNLFFRNGKITPLLFAEAQKAADNTLKAVWDRFSGMTWHDVIGTSGTIKTTRKVITSQGWGDKEITMDTLDKVIGAMINTESVDKLHSLKGLPQDRASVFPGGLAILRSVMRRFSIKSVKVSKAAMREGIILDLSRDSGFPCNA
ncbi:MAG: Ppx/GppA family phosphatase [Nitrospirae bacterium]|nr:Ppx/GppA family phosphatase [Nitrospirota bacterium]